MQKIIEVIIFSVTAFAVLFLLSKLMGKKQISQLDFVDYVIGISIGSIAAEMATETTDPFYHYIIAMVLFFLLDAVINYLGRKGPFLKKLLKGKPIVIIYEGKLVAENLKKSKLDINELLMLMREKDFFDIAQVEYALLETNGTLSVMPIGAERPTAAKDLSIPLEKASLPNYLIVDGAISYSGLNEINKDVNWIFNRLNIKSKRQLKRILLASYDDDKDDVIVHFQD